MKKLIFFLCLVSLIVANKVSAQAYVYHPMAVDSCEWYVYHTDNSDLPSKLSCYDGFAYVETDTLVYGKTYKEIWKTYVVNNLHYGVDTNFIADFGIRQVGKKVYWRVFPNAPGDFESLLYDYGINEGDTVKCECAYQPIEKCQVKCVEIDSVLLKDGNYRKTFVMKALNFFYTLSGFNNGYYDTWVEGIGSSITPFWSHGVPGDDGFFDEYRVILNEYLHVYDTLYYKNIDCPVGIKNDELIKAESDLIKIFPNPNNGKFQIVLDENLKYQNYNLLIFDNLGKQVYKTQTKNNIRFELKLNLSGNYTCVLQNNKIVARKPFIITKN